MPMHTPKADTEQNHIVTVTRRAEQYWLLMHVLCERILQLMQLSGSSSQLCQTINRLHACQSCMS